MTPIYISVFVGFQTLFFHCTFAPELKPWTFINKSCSLNELCVTNNINSRPLTGQVALILASMVISTAA